MSVHLFRSESESPEDPKPGNKDNSQSHWQVKGSLTSDEAALAPGVRDTRLGTEHHNDDRFLEFVIQHVKRKPFLE